jgi:hypothetical protein
MNGAVYTAAAPQLVIGCVDDSVYFQFGDVAANKSYRHNGYSLCDKQPLLKKQGL